MLESENENASADSSHRPKFADAQILLLLAAKLVFRTSWPCFLVASVRQIKVLDRAAVEPSIV